MARSIGQAGRLDVPGALDLAPNAQATRRSSNSAFRVRDVWEQFHVPQKMTEQIRTLSQVAAAEIKDKPRERMTALLATP